MSLDAATAAEYHALTAGAGWFDASQRTRLQLTGTDRLSFLNNLATNDVIRLEPGHGVESFLTNVQGKILAFVYVLNRPDAIWLSSSSDQAEKLIAHFERYQIREQVEFVDRTDATCELILAGRKASDVLAALSHDAVPADPISGRPMTLGDLPIEVWRLPSYGPCFSLVTERESVDRLAECLGQAGAESAGQRAAEIVRIENGTPLYGIDIDESRLPQELDRDQQAISFVKGCYLGQETVARIDALGHVNWLFRTLRFEQEAPGPGATLRDGERVIGRITSVADYSPHAGGPLALGYVRRELAAAGCRVGEATVAGP